MKILNKLILLLFLVHSIALSNEIIIPNNKFLIYELGQKIFKNYTYGIEDFKFIQKFENKLDEYSDYYNSENYYVFDSNVSFFHWYRDKFKIQELQRIFNLSYETEEEIYEFIIKEYFRDLIEKSELNLSKKHNIELKITKFLKFHREKDDYRIINGNAEELRNSLSEFIDLNELFEIVKNSKFKWNGVIATDGYINHSTNTTYDIPKYLLHIDTDLENKFKVNITIICVDCEGIYVKKNKLL